MARTVLKLDEEENAYFHLNYAYMWKKLNTAPYYVSGSGEIPKWIHEPWLLPSYVNLSKCLNETFVPSMNIVNKIVQFYNANIKPEVDSFAFLHEKLESSDNLRSTHAFSDTTPYCGLYQCYYYAGIPNKKEIYCALMKIQKQHDTTSVQMITGITTDDDINGVPLRELFRGKDISLDEYKKYRAGLELSKRRTTLYKGRVELAPGIMTLSMGSEDRAGSILVMRLPMIETLQGGYLGSIGLTTLISERDLQILKMCVMRADQKGLKPLKMDAEILHSMLPIVKKENEHMQLEFGDNSTWTEAILTQNG